MLVRLQLLEGSMSDNAIDDILIKPSAVSARLRTSLAFAFLAMSAMACLVASAVLIARARSESAQIEQRALSQASSLSFKLDQEVSAVRFLLRGLSKSPALLSGDLKGLYDQMKATDMPPGTWLLYQDLEKQLINTKLPFGAPLPRHTYFQNHQQLLDRIRDRGWTVSGRIIGPATGAVVVALNHRLTDSDGQMTHFLTTILDANRLRTILNDQKTPADWMKGLYDRQLQPIAMASAERSGSNIRAPPGLADRIRHRSSAAASEGAYKDENADGLPVLVAYRHSEATNWTAVIEVPLTSVSQPFKTALWQMGWLAAFLLLFGGMTAFFMTRRMEQPLNALSGMVSSSNQQISDLSIQLLHLQEEERQIIARELHDSTAQNLVAANIEVSNIRRKLPDINNACKTLSEVEALIDKSLNELRIFSYLLHPPDLERDGLQATLRDFIEGFAMRTDLIARIRIPEEIDAVPREIQWALLRVAQEALGNAHRHAGARRIFVNARVSATRLMFQIRDDGHGIKTRGVDDGKMRFGVGIPGMRARLKQFGGDLRIRSGTTGTTVAAIVPLTRMGRVSLQAERLAEIWPLRAGRADRKVL